MPFNQKRGDFSDVTRFLFTSIKNIRRLINRVEAILIRRLEAKTVAAIDDLARKKKVSREQYVRDLIHNHAISVEVEGLHEGYQDIVQKVLFALEKNTDILTKFLIANGVMEDGD